MRQKKINESAAKSQEKINGITDQIDSKLQQFKHWWKKSKALKVITPACKQINNQEQEMAI